MQPNFNYRHLHYFWVVAEEGGIARAAARLGVAVQTVSAQVRELERALGHALLRPAGRGLALTDAGLAARRQAEQIFQLGAALPALVRDAATSPSIRLSVGVSDNLPELVVWRLLQPALGEPHLRLHCQVDELDDLLADLALHRFDLVLADRFMPANRNLKLHGHPIGESGLSWYAPRSLAATARRGFPRSLARVPVLLPTSHAAARAQLDRWFDRIGIQPRIVGEFEDSALIRTFGSGGMGAFPAVDLVHDDLVMRYDVRRIGRCEDVRERFYLIGTEKKIVHPIVQRLLATPAPIDAAA